MFTLIHNFYTWQKEVRKKEKKVTIVILGIDNAGKTTLLSALQGLTPGTIAPTWGFNTETAQEGKFTVTYYDLGGGAKIRDIWSRYFPAVHGVIFVVDSADSGPRMDEAKATLLKSLTAECVPGKPILILANKQDLPQSLSHTQVADRLGLVDLHDVKFHVMGCTALTAEGQPPDPNVKKGLSWLLSAIDNDYAKLSKIVARDHAAQLEKEKIEKEEQKKRAAAARAARLRDEENERRKAAELEAGGAAGVTSDPPPHTHVDDSSAREGGAGGVVASGLVEKKSEDRSSSSRATVVGEGETQVVPISSSSAAGMDISTPPKATNHKTWADGAAGAGSSSEVTPPKRGGGGGDVEMSEHPSMSSSSNPRALPALTDVSPLAQSSRAEFSARLPPLLAPLKTTDDQVVSPSTMELPNMILSPPKVENK